MSFKILLSSNKLFFKIFILCLIFYFMLGCFFGFIFFLNACFMAFSTLVLHLINVYFLVKKITNYKITFKPLFRKSRIFIYDNIEQVKRKKIFFAIPKIFIYVIIGLWIYVLVNANALNVFGILLGGSTTAICSVAQGFLNYRR